MNDTARVQVLTAVIILGTFVSGAALGAGIYHMAGRRHHGPPPPWHHRMSDELALTSDQREKAKAIRERHHAALESILQEGYPKVRAENDKLDKELREILTPEQQKKFDELRAQHPRPGPGGPGHHRGLGHGPGPEGFRGDPGSRPAPTEF